STRKGRWPARGAGSEGISVLLSERPAHSFLNSMPVSSNKPSYRCVRPIQPATGPKAKGSEGLRLSREQVIPFPGPSLGELGRWLPHALAKDMEDTKPQSEAPRWTSGPAVATWDPAARQGPQTALGGPEERSCSRALRGPVGPPPAPILSLALDGGPHCGTRPPGAAVAQSCPARLPDDDPRLLHRLSGCMPTTLDHETMREAR
ncbi:hypothetical protein EI555_000365, partial [Monodon monoceros]